MSLDVKVTLRGLLNEDVAGYIQKIANNQKSEMMHELHAEYFQKLAILIENKIDAIEMNMEDMWQSEYESPYLTAEKKMWEWSYVLDDIFYKSGKVVNSRYRPDPEMM